MSDKIPVVEIFGPTIQGEGPNVGARCIFVRVRGCSFACKWCDSKFTWNGYNHDAAEYEPEMLGKVLNLLCKQHNCKHIVLTGGNPCLYDFIKVLHTLDLGIHVDVETQGDLFPDWLTFSLYVKTIVFSPKAPSSGMPDVYDKLTSYLNNHTHDKLNVAIKIPVFNDEDIEFARKYAKFIKDYKRIDDGRNTTIKMYLSVGNSDVNTTESIRDRVLSDYEKLLNKINESPEDFENIYILPQVHTLVWGNKQGV